MAFIFLVLPLSTHRAQANVAGAIVGSVLSCISLTDILSGVSGSLQSAVSSVSKVPVADSIVQSATEGIEGITGQQLNKDCSLDAFAYAAQKIISDQILENALKFINGDGGAPAFIDDPSLYFHNIAEKTAEDFIQSGELSNIYGPYQTQIRLSLDDYFDEKTGKKSYADRATCGLEKLVTDSEGFRSGDFSKGGWGAWLEATQNPYCNPYGANVTAREELDRIVTIAVQEERDLANWGEGLKSIVSEDGKVLTPGVLLSGQLNKILGQSIDQLTNADEINEVAAQGAAALINNMFRGGLTTDS